MSRLEAILRWVGLAVAWLVKGEQGYWGPRLARRVVRAAVLLVSVLGARRRSWRAPKVGGFLGAVLGMELGGLVGLQGGGGLAVLAGLDVGPVVGGVLLSWGAAATDVWLGISADAELTPGSADR
ncbi:MAG: hypothetical protein ACRDYA_23940 [Egibacteraceae bacterium]